MKHLKRVNRHSTAEERFDFHDPFLKALSHAGSFLKGEAYILLPATRRIDRGRLRPDDEPYISMHERQSAHDRIIHLRTELISFLFDEGYRQRLVSGCLSGGATINQSNSQSE